MKRLNRIFSFVAIATLVLVFESCLKEHTDLVPELEGVPAGGLTSMRVVSVSGNLAEVELSFFVVDHLGGFLQNLDVENFTAVAGYSSHTAVIKSLTEEDDEERGPFSATLLFDQSGSINSTDPSDARIDAGVSFASIVDNGDEASVVAFAQGGYFASPYEEIQGFTTNPDKLTTAIETLAGKAEGYTPLYVSIYELIETTANEGTNENRAIVAFTDGEDTEGSYTVPQIIQRACAEGVRVYTVGLGSAVNFLELSSIAFETGGAVMLAEDAIQLIALYNSLGALLHGQAEFYRMRLQVINGDGAWETGDIISGNIALQLSESFTINFPYEVLVRNIQDDPFWYLYLPPCPCTYAEAQALADAEDCPNGRWDDCGSASDDFHYGATYEVRWYPEEDGLPGQQCTYNANKELITQGIAAGSPDLYSPRSCGWGDFLNGIGIAIGCDSSPHCVEDVQPWITGDCLEYLQNWPANNTNNCDPRPVTSIWHMQNMVRDMTCAAISELFRIVDGTSDVDPNLQAFFHDPDAWAPSNLKDMLIDLQGKANCLWYDCSVIQMAIDNL